MEEPLLDDYEKECVRFFAERYRSHKEIINHEEFPRYNEVGRQKVLDARKRIREACLIAGFHTEAIKVLPRCVEIVQQWDNPPLRDRWDEVTKWFRSKPWSLPVLVLLVGLPALKGWVDVLKAILEWMIPGRK